MTEKEILEIRNKIFLEYGIPALISVGFQKSPFPSDWHGRDNLNDFTYSLCRLNNSFLETIETQISRGDRWIKIFLNIFDLNPPITNLDDLKKCDSVRYKIPPASLTEMRVNQDNYQGMPLFNPNSNRHKLRRSISTNGLKRSIEKLRTNIQNDLTKIDAYVKQWHKIHKPLRVDWNGRLYGIDDMTISQRLESTSLNERFYSVANKDISEAERILKWLEVDEESIKNMIKTTANKVQ
ncbi:MAG: hypothetical protein RJQ14_17325 [Marinoscillum sp.]